MTFTDEEITYLRVKHASLSGHRRCHERRVADTERPDRAFQDMRLTAPAQRVRA